MGAITTFIVEPFMPHFQEVYLSIQQHLVSNATERQDDLWQARSSAAEAPAS